MTVHPASLSIAPSSSFSKDTTTSTGSSSATSMRRVGRGSTSGTGSSSATTRTTTTTMYRSGATTTGGSRYGVSSSAIGGGASVITRPPVILSFVSLALGGGGSSSTSRNDPTKAIIEAGHVGQSRWKHTVEVLPFAITTTKPIDEPRTNSDGSSSSSSVLLPVDTITVDKYYRMYANCIEHIFHLLGQDSKDRRVIVIHNYGIIVPRAWKLAIQRILQDVIGIPAVSFQSSLSMIPFAFLPSSSSSTSLSLSDGSNNNSSHNSTTSSTNKNNTFLVVHITLQEAQCIIFSDKVVLDYTFQSCGYPQPTEGESSADDNYNISMLDVKNRQSRWISTDLSDISSSLVLTIIKTLEACPRQIRLAAINSIIFSGNIVDPGFGKKITKVLYSVLSSIPPETSAHRATTKSEEATTSDSRDDTTQQSSSSTTDITGTTTTNSYAVVPYDAKVLYPLADYIAIVQMIPQQIRSDLFSWIGTSAWASYWHENHDPDAKQFQWTTLQSTTLSSAQIIPSTSAHQ